MYSKTRFLLAVLTAGVLAAGSASAGDLSDSLKQGTPDLKSAGPIAFGPEGILFIGDPQGAAVFAIDTGDKKANPSSGPINVEGVDGKIASMLGTTEKDLLFNDLAVNPTSGKAYLSLSRGKGPDAAGVVIRVSPEGQIEELPLKDVKFSKANLNNAVEGGRRRESITKLAYIDGRVFVAGLSNEHFDSRLRALPFPFKDSDKGTTVEIYHGSHGRFETNSPVRTFVPFEIKGEPYILAAYTCTPLVKIPVSQLKEGERVKGTTIAELGNRNRPLDMVVYQKDGKDYILMANNSRGVMKISTENIDKIEGITGHVKDKAGLGYETIADLKGVMQLARLDKEHAVLVVQKAKDGPRDLQTIALP